MALTAKHTHGCSHPYFAAAATLEVECLVRTEGWRYDCIHNWIAVGPPF